MILLMSRQRFELVENGLKDAGICEERHEEHFETLVAFLKVNYCQRDHRFDSSHFAEWAGYYTDIGEAPVFVFSERHDFLKEPTRTKALNHPLYTFLETFVECCMFRSGSASTRHRNVYLWGAGGTGKTATLKHLSKIFRTVDLKVKD